jgi:hypothetical protein
MESAFGWTQIARSDVAKATELLKGGEQGVRDEIGFLSLHQGFADRFFPGTSVLQTRLRYALFVPWQFQELAERRAALPAEEGLKRLERALVIRLRDGMNATPAGDRGVIGLRSENYQPAQPPSMIYWTALRLWGILHPVGKRLWPGRAEVLARIDGQQRLRAEQVEEGDPAADGALFYALPAAPPNWKREGGRGLTFRLLTDERKYLTKRIATAAPIAPGRSDAESLLSRLAGTKRPRVSWIPGGIVSPLVMRAADKVDRDALKVAAAAASLSHIGRAVYSALVERLVTKYDKKKPGDTYAKALAKIVTQARASALACDLDSVRTCIGPLDATFHTALAATLTWLKTPNRDVEDLLVPYSASEEARKEDRSRLLKRPQAAKLRAIWLSEGAPEAQPLNYRWHRVGQLLDDLHGFHG